LEDSEDESADYQYTGDCPGQIVAAQHGSFVGVCRGIVKPIA
jgi:hypothetical protein